MTYLARCTGRSGQNTHSFTKAVGDHLLDRRTHPFHDNKATVSLSGIDT